MPAASRKIRTTTVRLPSRLYDEARIVVEKGATNARSLNDLLVTSLSEKLKHLRRERIDAEFAQMRHDTQYRRESEVIEQQFHSNDLETLKPFGKGQS